jgi:subtilisin
MRQKWFLSVLAIAFTALLAFLLGSSAPVVNLADDGSTGVPPDIAPLLDIAQERGSVSVIVGLNVPGYNVDALSSDAALEAQSAAITRAQSTVLDRLAGHNVEGIKQFQYIPYMALRTDAAGLEALREQPEVSSIVEDAIVPPALDVSIPLVRADAAHLLNYRGSGQTVAILDTGVDRFHPDLAGKVVSEACYSTTDASANRTTLCPNGQESQTGAGAATPPSRFIDGFDHGTHVAGIAAGVAPRANIIAIQVFSRVSDVGTSRPCTSNGRTSPCTLTLTSDYLTGLQRVFILRNSFNIAAVNMSLGGGAYLGPCDVFSQFAPVKLQVEIMRNFGIATVASAGNNSYRVALNAPACLSNVISVGATVSQPDDDVDDVADFSNNGSILTLFAPGTPINAAVPGTTTTCGGGQSPIDGRCYKGGTSMAAPHVAGAIAVLRSASPSSNVNQLVGALTSSGPFIRDQRSGGVYHNKRRLDVYGAVCRLRSCDADDFRTVALNQTLVGTISSGETQDYYYHEGSAGQRISASMNRTSGTLDPFLSVWDPDGALIAYNNDGGAGTNALVNVLILPDSGRYRLHAGVARSGLTGGYQIRVAQGPFNVNPAPLIQGLQPTSATAGSQAFWMQIHGVNFLPTSVALLDGSVRSTYYSNSGLIWIWLTSTDLRVTGTRRITVYNPSPGGGTSNAYAFNVSFPFRGASALLAPTKPTTPVGVKTTFVYSWTHPTASWRNMQNLDFRLVDSNLSGPLWLRLTEDNPTSTLSLLNSGERAVYSGTLASGQFGADEDWVFTDTVTLHLGETKFFGSGQTIVITPVVTFGPAAVGTYDMRFSVDDDQEESEVQDADVFGLFTVLPEGCESALEDVTISGPTTARANRAYTFDASVTPLDASRPITYTWLPEPDSGQGTSSATYLWPTAGEQFITVIAENCASFDADTRSVRVSTTDTPDLAISVTGPPVALPGQEITYRLTYSNSGVLTATNVLITNTLPAGATYVSGGTRVGDTIQWSPPDLAGYGTTEERTLTVTADETIVNAEYGMRADGGASATGNVSATTRIVDAYVRLTPLVTGTMAYTGPDASTVLTIPAGSVFEDTTVAYEELDEVTHPLSSASVEGASSEGVQVLRSRLRSFRLSSFRAGRPAPDLSMGESFSITLSLSSSTVAASETSSLVLLRWDGSRWSAEGITCADEPAGVQVTCSVAPMPLGEYVLTTSENKLYLPMLLNTYRSGAYAQIYDIARAGSTYQVYFRTYGFTPQLPGVHVHFFFNTVPPDQAGVPGSGPWYVYGGSSPFTGYGTADRPYSATQMCVLVANPDHSVMQGTGNCYNLP